MTAKTPVWTWLIPVLAVGFLLVALVAGVEPWLAVLCGAALAAAVFVAVHHAEVVSAHRAGEPFGTLVLALAVTSIETAPLGTGRTYMMQGAVHLVLFAAFLLLAFVP